MKSYTCIIDFFYFIMEILDIVIKKKTTEETNYRHINIHTFYTEQFQNVQIKIKARSIVF